MSENPGLIVLSKIPSSTLTMQRPIKLLVAPWQARTMAQRILLLLIHCFRNVRASYIEIDIVFPRGSLTKMIETG